MAKRLGDLLLEKGLIKPDQLEKALQEQQRSGEFLGTTLVQLKMIDESQLLHILAQQFKLPVLRLAEYSLDPAAIKLVPAKFVHRYKVMPIFLSGKTLTVAIHNPMVRWPLDELALQLGYEVQPMLATESEITEAIRKHYGVGAETVEKILDQEPVADRAARAQPKTENIESSSEDASVIRLVNQILQEAVRQGATDIHIEPFRDEMMLRYRVDGRLYDTPASPDLKYFYQAIVSRIKIMAGLDIIERRMPQDGRARIQVGEQGLDMRVSVLPTLYGENIVIRMLPSSMILGLDRIGLTPANQKMIEDLLQLPHGVIFVTGPTGSGKTTTLYACLNRLNSRDRKIVTVEDPVEYELKGITQIQVNARINLTFARTLRNMLRHDPNVMMVGEVRDRETAEITIQAALTGHLVFSTLHTNDAVGAVARLQDMGVEPYLVASAVKAFIAQRLVRLICQNCKEEAALESVAAATRLSLAELRGKIGPSEKFYRGKGCDDCRQTGYRGRTAIYEILIVDSAIQQKIIQKAPAQEIQALAFARGRGTLLEDGWIKVKQGVTTLEEVLRVIQLEPNAVQG